MYTTKEVMEMLDTSAVQLQAWRKLLPKSIQPIKEGRRLQWPQISVDAMHYIKHLRTIHHPKLPGTIVYPMVAKWVEDNISERTGG